MMLKDVAEKVRNGQEVTFIARGASMTPKIKDGAIVTVGPLDKTVEKGDVVLVKVRNQWYLHLVTALKKGMVQISNNHGHVNGWTSEKQVVGLLKR